MIGISIDLLLGCFLMEEKPASADSLPTLWLVIPCYNEEDVLPITAPMFKGAVASLIGDGLVREELGYRVSSMVLRRCSI